MASACSWVDTVKPNNEMAIEEKNAAAGLAGFSLIRILPDPSDQLLAKGLIN